QRLRVRASSACPPRLPSQNPTCAPIRAPATAASSTCPSDRCRVVVALAEQYSPAVNSSESPGRKNPASRPVSANTTTNTPSAPGPAGQKEAVRGPAAVAPVAARNGCAASCRTCTVALLRAGCELPPGGAGDRPVAAVPRPATGRSPAVPRPLPALGWNFYTE